MPSSSAVARSRPESEDAIGAALVCIPAYDERENLEAIVRALLSVLGSADQVLVVDDNSRDGTGEPADALAAELAQFEVVHRQAKEGLGPAYLAAFRYALAGEAEIVVQIDCDFSHDPRDVPRLLAAAAGADLVFGSRYVPGGAVRNWSGGRHALSRFGSLYSRLILRLPVRDLTGGFKCYRRGVPEAIDLDSIRARGYAFQIETTFRAIRAGFSVVEIPITFTERRLGGSKMTGSIALEALWRVPLLRARAMFRRP
jgi:dolichol-phosphate mannosyltransferase